MRLFDRLDRYLVDNEYKVIIEKGRISIFNYVEIVDFSSTRVVVKYREGNTIFLGRNLVVSKMLEDELLITGKLDGVEYK